MQFFSNINIKPLPNPIKHQDKILLVGSCFTEHIGSYLKDMKFNVLQNPNGIVFNPHSVCNSIISYIDNKQYSDADLFHVNEAWHSWQHHSSYSSVQKQIILANINSSQQNAHTFLKQADWVIITLGSAFVYQHLESNQYVANCHKVQAQNFRKHLLSIEDIIVNLDTLTYRLLQYNQGVKIIFTISPVRHLRDGMIENNRSKARLIEAVHHIVEKFEGLYYFPAYELVIDVLRDYRFFDIDLVHPNYSATNYVLQQFSHNCLDKNVIGLIEEIKKINLAKKHKPFNPQSNQHKLFLKSQLERVSALSEDYKYINFSEEIEFFSEKI